MRGVQLWDDEVSGKGGCAIHYRRWKGADKSPYQPCLLPTELREQSKGKSINLHKWDMTQRSLCLYIGLCTYLALALTLYYNSNRVPSRLRQTSLYKMQRIVFLLQAYLFGYGWCFLLNQSPKMYLNYTATVYNSFLGGLGDVGLQEDNQGCCLALKYQTSNEMLSPLQELCARPGFFHLHHLLTTLPDKTASIHDFIMIHSRFIKYV